MKDCIKGLKRRVKEARKSGGGVKKDGSKRGKEGRMEMRERKERRKNIIIKGVKVKDGKRREAVKKRS